MPLLTCPNCNHQNLIQGRVVQNTAEYLCPDCLVAIRGEGSRLEVHPADRHRKENPLVGQQAPPEHKDDFDFDLEKGSPDDLVVPCPTCPSCASRRGHTVPGGCFHCPDCGETWQNDDYV